MVANAAAVKEGADQTGQKLVPPSGVIKLMRKLLARGKPRKVVMKRGFRMYAEAGFTDRDTINRRLEICLEFAQKEEVAPVAKKKAKPSKTKAEAKPAKKGAKAKEAEVDCPKCGGTGQVPAKGAKKKGDDEEE